MAKIACMAHTEPLLSAKRLSETGFRVGKGRFATERDFLTVNRELGAGGRL
jgi:hypothetical protein